MNYSKKCSKCGDIKDISNFHKNKSKLDGVNSYCKPCSKIYLKEYLSKNKKQDKERRKRYRSKKLTKDKRNFYTKNKYKSDINFKLKSVLRSRLVGALKNRQKNGSAISNLGCSVIELKVYLESKFKPGMTWDNWKRDGWHIDHIIPLSKFNLSNPKDFNKANHYTNLQPLWASENMRKGCSG